MADAATLSAYADFLYEKQAQAQQVFAREYPLLAVLSGSLAAGGYDKGYKRYDRGLAELHGDRETYSGSNVRIPLQLTDVSAAGTSEGSTWPAAFPFDTAKATLTLSEVIAPIAVTLSLDRDARNGSTSAMESVAAYVDSAYRAAARIENDFCHGTGDGLLCNVASATGSGTLVVPVGTGTNVPWDQITPGRVLSILTRTNGADPGNGKRRKVDSVDRAAGTVTFLTAAVASDGGSGAITFSATSGIYIDSSYGKAAQGLGQATANSTTFEGIDQAAVAQWQAIKYTASAALSDGVIRHVEYLSRANGAQHDLAIGHDLVIDLYLESKASQVRYTPQDMVLKSGFSAAVYNGSPKPIPLLKDPNAPRAILRLLQMDTFQMYGDAVGPAFINDDGTMWRFFNRANIKEADLYDRYQLGFKDVNKLAEISGLSEAS